METPLQRMELLIGENNLEILKRSTVMVVGVGGVGKKWSRNPDSC